MKLTPEDVKEIQKAARATWDEIAYDSLQCAGGSMPKAEVIEVVLDANRIDHHLKDKRLRDYINDPKHYKEVDKIVGEEFKSKRYVL